MSPKLISIFWFFGMYCLEKKKVKEFETESAGSRERSRRGERSNGGRGGRGRTTYTLCPRRRTFFSRLLSRPYERICRTCTRRLWCRTVLSLSRTGCTGTGRRISCSLWRRSNSCSGPRWPPRDTLQPNRLIRQIRSTISRSHAYSEGRRENRSSHRRDTSRSGWCGGPAARGTRRRCIPSASRCTRCRRSSCRGSRYTRRPGCRGPCSVSRTGTRWPWSTRPSRCTTLSWSRPCTYDQHFERSVTITRTYSRVHSLQKRIVSFTPEK